MGQFACVVYIVAITSLCCVSAMYIDRSRSDSDDIISTNIMKVFGRRRHNMDGKKYGTTTHEDYRSPDDNSHHSERLKKQSQLTFIIKPGTAPPQLELTTISGNHSNTPGVIFIQVPAYVNHSYSLFLHPPQNNSNNSHSQEATTEDNDSSINDATNLPESVENVDNQNEDMEQTEMILENKPMINPESDGHEFDGDHEPNGTQDAEESNDENLNEGDNDDSESHIESSNVDNMNDSTLEMPEVSNEDGVPNDFDKPQNDMADVNPADDHISNDEPQNEGEQNVEDVIGNNPSVTENNNDDNINAENTDVSPTPEEDVTENDDCDEDIDESQDFPNDNEENENGTESDTNEGNQVMESVDSVDIFENANPSPDELNSEDKEDGVVDKPIVTQQEESIPNDESDNEPISQIESNGEAVLVMENVSPTAYEESSTVGTDDMERPETINQNEVQDSNAEASIVNENVDKDDQNGVPESLASENNDIGNDNSDSAKPGEDDSHKDQENQTENGQTDYDDDVQNTLDQNEQTTPAFTGSGTLNMALKEYCLEVRGQFASPHSCSKYVNCWDGMPYEHDCPPGLFFNTALGLCDWKHKVDCGDRPLDSPMAENCLENPHSTFRNPDDCSEYFVCITKEPKKFKCPEGLNYNDILGVCDHKYRVNCGNSTASNTENATKVETRRISPGLVATDMFCKPDYVGSVGRSCRRVDICSSEGRILQVRCPTLTAYDVKAKKCIYEGTARC